MVPYLTRVGVPLGAAYEGSGFMGAWPVPATDTQEVAEAFALLFTDPEFRSLAETRYFWIAATTGEIEDALGAVSGALNWWGRNWSNLPFASPPPAPHPLSSIHSGREICRARQCGG